MIMHTRRPGLRGAPVLTGCVGLVALLGIGGCWGGSQGDHVGEMDLGEAENLADEAGDAEADASGARFVLEIVEDAFDRAPDVAGTPFAVLAADFDFDGDPDLLINNHVLGPLEFFINEKGSYVASGPPWDRDWGLYENPYVPWLYSKADAMDRRVKKQKVQGLTVWHDNDRKGRWRFKARGPVGQVTLTATSKLGDPKGVSDFERVDENTVVVNEPRGEFSINATATAAMLRVQGPQHIYVGPWLVDKGPSIDLWKPDSHGITWVDVRGDRRPEVVVTRGALRGTLKPPLPPKTDRFYDFEDNRYRLNLNALPPGYGSGRQAEWVDVNADGTLELYISQKDGPNALYFATETEQFEDRAQAHGLDLPHDGAFTFLDVDGDADDDIIYVEDPALAWRRNDGGRFTPQPAAALGLDGFEMVSPAPEPEVDEEEGDGEDTDEAETQIDESDDAAVGEELGDVDQDAAEEAGPTAIPDSSLATCDVNHDGALDLLVVGYGTASNVALFHGTEDGFTRSDDAAIASLKGIREVTCIDLNNNGNTDLVAIGPDGVFTLEFRGGRLRRNRVPDVNAKHGVAADVDADGRTDLVFVGAERTVMHNATDNRHRWVDVRLPANAIGAVVTAITKEGKRNVQRHGSMSNTGHSQSLQALHFGSAAGDPVVEVHVRWPGVPEPTSHEVTKKKRLLKPRSPNQAETEQPE